MVAIANSIPKDVAERSFIAQAEKLILTLPQLAINPVHRFSDGLYIREQSFPKDSVALGFEHVGECLNIVLFGRGMIFVDGHVRHIVGPAVFTSGPNGSPANGDMWWDGTHLNFQQGGTTHVIV